jgi:hypothetical protein
VLRRVQQRPRLRESIHEAGQGSIAPPPPLRDKRPQAELRLKLKHGIEEGMRHFPRVDHREQTWDPVLGELQIGTCQAQTLKIRDSRACCRIDAPPPLQVPLLGP